MQDGRLAAATGHAELIHLKVIIKAVIHKFILTKFKLAASSVETSCLFGLLKAQEVVNG